MLVGGAFAFLLQGRLQARVLVSPLDNKAAAHPVVVANAMLCSMDWKMLRVILMLLVLMVKDFFQCQDCPGQRHTYTAQRIHPKDR